MIDSTTVIASAAKQSIYRHQERMDCFEEPVVRRRFAPTGWLAMTLRERRYRNEQRHRRVNGPQSRLRRLGAELRRQALRRNFGAGFLLLQSRQVAGRPSRVFEADGGTGDHQKSE